MSLTAVEQLTLMSGAVSPSSTDLQSLVLQNAFIYAQNLATNHKVFASEDQGVPINQEATRYLNKVFGVSSRLMNNDTKTLAVLTRMIVVIMGVNVTPTQINGATDDQWSGFILNNMDEAFEYVSGVRLQEKTAYAAL